VLRETVSSFEQKYSDIVTLIDMGEHSLCLAGQERDGVGASIRKATYHDSDNYGLFSASVYFDSLRIRIVFKHDVCVETTEQILADLRGVANECDYDDVHIWCSNYNPHLVDALRARLGPDVDMYRADEMKYSRSNIERDVDSAPLTVRAFSDDMLDDALLLLDDSFQHLRGAHSFLSERDGFRTKFSGTGKSRFEAFYLAGELVGFYYHNDAEMEYVAVATRHQGRGFGTLMLRRALVCIIGDSSRAPHLYCVEENTKALAFYRRNGWQTAGRPVRLSVKRAELRAGGR
jgi:ribosomal protein S18 acetylase RimI-like enzyme